MDTIGIIESVHNPYEGPLQPQYNPRHPCEGIMYKV